jgi:tetrahydromethanopterin S-methyltransferase subunit E
MSFYQKYLLVAASIGIIGIPIFVLDWNDLSWASNAEIYWGWISMVAIIVAVVVQYLASKKLKAKN